MTEAQQAAYLEHMRNGMERGAAAYEIGLATRLEAIDFIAANPEFERQVVDAQEEAAEHVNEAIWQAAVSGSVAAARLWHQLKRPSQSPLPMTGEDGDWDAELAEIARLTSE